MEANVYNKKGEIFGKIELPRGVFGLPWNGDMVSQTINSIRSSTRTGTANAKDRSEVRGGGRKPWKQKGTGRARHGSTRSPIWVGGGATHGPRSEKNYDRKVNKKVKDKTLYTILSAKFRDGELLFVDDASIGEVKTKKATEMLKIFSGIKGYEKINYKNGNRALIYLPNNDEKTIKSFKNIKTVSVDEVRNMDPFSVINYKFIVISSPEKSLKMLS